jgi:predicted Zn-dependent protease
MSSTRQAPSHARLWSTGRGPSLWGRRLLALAAPALLVVIALVWIQFRQRRERDDALHQASAGKFADVEQRLRHTLDRNPADADAARALALGTLALDRLGESETYFERWRLARPNDPQPYRERMQLWARLERAPAALEDGLRVLELDPADGAMRKQVVGLFLQTGRLADSEKECRRQLDHNPADGDWRYYLAATYQGQGRLADAAQAIRPLVNEHTSSAAILLLAGMIALETGRAEDATQLLRRCLVADPDRPQRALYYLSLALEQTGRPTDAERARAEWQWWQTSATNRRHGQSGTAGLQICVAQAHIGLGQFNEAAALLERVVSQNPHCSAASMLLAMCYEKTGQHERAALCRRRAAEP